GGSGRGGAARPRPSGRAARAATGRLVELAGELGLRVVATNDVHVHDRRRGALQDALVAIRVGRPLDGCEADRRGNREHVLKAPEAMAALFADLPEAVHETRRLAERCTFDPTVGLGYRYPSAEDHAADHQLALL